MYDILQLNEMLVTELKEIADELNIEKYKRLNKKDLIFTILDHQALLNGPSKQTENMEEEKEKKSRTRITTKTVLRKRKDSAKYDEIKPQVPKLAEEPPKGSN